MAQAPKLNAAEWAKVRAVWERDERDGLAWIVREMGLPVTPPAVRKKAVAQQWRKAVDGRQLSSRPIPEYNHKRRPASDESEHAFQQRFARALASGSLARRCGWPPVIDVTTEYRLGLGACDAVAFHEDGSITLCELKRAGLSHRDCMTGVGQLISASVQLGLSLRAAGARRTVRLVLSTPGKADDAVGYACLMAGIEYLPFDSEWREREVAYRLIEELKGKGES